MPSASSRGRAEWRRLAKTADLNRESLYKALGESGNPELGTVLRVLQALGLYAHRASDRSEAETEEAAGALSAD